MSRTILAIDQGTTSSRAIVFSEDGNILAAAQKELRLVYPQNGWVEQNPEDIWADTRACCSDVLKKYPDVAAIGITNQRETTILWDRATGKPLYNAIVWQDRRTADLCARLKSAGHEKKVTEKTGLLLDPYFSATKIAWILDNVPGARDRAARGAVAFGTVDCFLLWHLTGGKVHATDATNASRTMLFNIRTQEWDADLLTLFNIPRAILPEVKDNVADFGTTDTSLFGRTLPIGGMAGDQQAALIGQTCFTPGMAKSTYGTGCFMLMNIGTDFKTSPHRLLTTIAYRLNGQTSYALEGAIFVAGAAVQWLRDNLKIITHAFETETLARSAADTDGVYFVPAFTGLGAPYWDPEARGGIFGLTRGTTNAHIVRATLEAQGYQTRDILSAFAADGGYALTTLRADGGLMTNEFVCQFLADMLDCPIELPKITETTAVGAAYLAGLSAGIYRGLDDLSARWACGKRFTPVMDPARRENLYAGWQSAVRRIQTY